jgi:hypothetical protein
MRENIEKSVKLGEMGEFVVGKLEERNRTYDGMISYFSGLKSPLDLKMEGPTKFIVVDGESEDFLPGECLNQILACGLIEGQDEFMLGPKHSNLYEAIRSAEAKEGLSSGKRIHYWQRGGGQIHVTDDSIHLFDESVDYGKYDKEMARPIAERMRDQYFPNLEVICE